MKHFDVIIVGAGLSGIGAAYHLQNKNPNKTYAILEGRSAMGGTWDLFKYPGIRSDSDMYTLGYSFNPWPGKKSIASGASINQYIKDTATKFGIDKHIKYKHKVKKAKWNSSTNKWTISVENEGRLTCDFFFVCSGYYNYKAGYTPKFKGLESYKGEIVHPQGWDDSIVYANKKIVVIGSGATAITLVPELAKKADKVTMLQRSPTYLINQSSKDFAAPVLKKIFSQKVANDIIRGKNILQMTALFAVSRSFPTFTKKALKIGVQKEMGFSFEKKHFTPQYQPWDQRLCVVPDSVFFDALKSKKANIVTDQISTFTEKGIQLKSGKHLDADMVITATGLDILMLGGMKVFVDDKEVDIPELHSYRGVLFSDLPNFAMASGYTNASWTLKSELNSQYVCRILDYMQRHNYKSCIPKYDKSKYESGPLLDLEAGYVKRAKDKTPKQGSESPWKVYQNYFFDFPSLKYSTLINEHLKFK